MGSCLSSAGVFLAPEVTVEDCVVHGIGMSGVKTEVVLKAFNRNPTSLNGTRIAYVLKKASDGTVLAEGIFDHDFTIQGRHNKTVNMPVTLRYGGLGAAGESLVQRGATKILVAGDATFVAELAPGGQVVVPYRNELDIMLEEE